MVVDLKHDFDESRYFVNKNKFWYFQNKYKELQEENKDPVSVEAHIIVEIRELMTNKIIQKDAFIPITTVFGGMEGVKLYIKKLVINTVYTWEDSPIEIIKIILNKLYVKKLKQDL